MALLVYLILEHLTTTASENYVEKGCKFKKLEKKKKNHVQFAKIDNDNIVLGVLVIPNRKRPQLIRK